MASDSRVAVYVGYCCVSKITSIDISDLGCMLAFINAVKQENAFRCLLVPLDPEIDSAMQ